MFSPPGRISVPLTGKGLSDSPGGAPFSGVFRYGAKPALLPAGGLATSVTSQSPIYLEQGLFRGPTGCRSILSGHTHFGVRHGPGVLYT